jgi:hypothetical protein
MCIFYADERRAFQDIYNAFDRNYGSIFVFYPRTCRVIVYDAKTQDEPGPKWKTMAWCGFRLVEVENHSVLCMYKLI